MCSGEKLQRVNLPCVEIATVVKTERVAKNGYLTEFRSPKIGALANAGQFVMVSFLEVLDPLLPRAYSISDVNGENLSLFYTAIGKGSKRLSMLRPGDIVRINGPLGNGFPIPSREENIWIAVGGSGAALLPILSKMMVRSGSHFQVFYGARTKDEIAEFGVDSVRYATDDGSVGYHGTVVQFLEEALFHDSGSVYEMPSRIFACGPTPMLVSLQGKIGKKIPTYISVETPMACGMGLCQGCPVKVKGKADYLLACKDGPVFESQEIEL
jgi:dihydroorotate dehydrogenase electron transfer subunit